MAVVYGGTEPVAPKKPSFYLQFLSLCLNLKQNREMNTKNLTLIIILAAVLILVDAAAADITDS
jgi:hypothetical protein